MVVVKNTSSFGDRLPGVKISGISHILAKELARQGKNKFEARQPICK